MPKKGEFKVKKALDNTHTAVQNVNEVLEKMSDQQRRLFVSLAKGYDYIKAALDSNNRQFYEGIVRIVYTKKLGPMGNPVPMEIEKLTMENIDELDQGSYDRLNRIAGSYVKKYIQDFNPEEYMQDVNNLFKLVAPDALATITQIALDEKVDKKTRLAASKDLLDRAGYGLNKPNKEGSASPVLIQINMGGTPKSENNPVEVWKTNKEEESGV